MPARKREHSQRPLRVLFVVHGFPPRSMAGTELHNLALARELARTDRVFVYARENNRAIPDYATRTEDHGGLTIRWVNQTLKQRWDGPQDSYANARIARDFESFLEQVKPDIVHVAHTIWLSTSIIETAASKHIPTALQLNDFYYMCQRVHLYHVDEKPCSGPETGEKCARCIRSETIPHLRASQLWRFRRLSAFKKFGVQRNQYMQSLLRLPDTLFAPSAFVKEKYIEFGVPEKKIVLSPYGLESFTASPRTKSSRFRFGFLGHLHLHKGPIELVEAFAGLDQDHVELSLYGLVGVGLQMKLQWKARGCNVVFRGTYEHEMLPKILASLDAVVVPSNCHESFSFTTREALMGGLPVIVSNLRAQSDAIANGVNGLHFRAGDTEDLQEKMLLMQDPALYTKLAESARRTRQRTIHDEANFLRQQYSELTSAS